MGRLVLILVGTGLAMAMSPSQLTAELVGDLHWRVADSLGVEQNQLVFDFDEDALSRYVAECFTYQGQQADTSAGREVQVRFMSLEMELFSLPGGSNRNKTYGQRLKAKVALQTTGGTWSWTQQVTDKLSKAEFKAVVQAPFPGEITGAVVERAPNVWMIVTTTSLVFILVSSLFFSRT